MLLIVSRETLKLHFAGQSKSGYDPDAAVLYCGGAGYYYMKRSVSNHFTEKLQALFFLFSHDKLVAG